MLCLRICKMLRWQRKSFFN